MKRTYTIFVLIMLANPFRYEWYLWAGCECNDSDDLILLANRCRFLRSAKRTFFVEWSA